MELEGNKQTDKQTERWDTENKEGGKCAADEGGRGREKKWTTDEEEVQVEGWKTEGNRNWPQHPLSFCFAYFLTS